MATKAELAQNAQNGAQLLVNNSFIDALSNQLQEKQKYGLSFPVDYNPTNSLMSAYLIMKETVDKNGKNILESCSQASIANSLMEMVTTGLDASKKQGYFISYGGKCQFQKSYFGNVTLARRFGMKSISADIIYQDDVFKYHKEKAKTVIDVHEQELKNIDNDKIIGAYAVATMLDGEEIVEIMTIAQLKKAWNQRMGGLKEDATSTHTKFRDQMAKKTVINRLCKMIANTHSNDGFVIDSFDNEDALSDVNILAENTAYEVEQNANTVPFEDVVAADVVVEAEVVAEEDLPDFLK